MANHVTTNLTIEGSKELMDFLEEKRKLVDERRKEDHYLAFVGAFLPDIQNRRDWFWCPSGLKVTQRSRFVQI